MEENEWHQVIFGESREPDLVSHQQAAAQFPRKCFVQTEE